MIIWCPPAEGIPCKSFVDPPALIRYLEEKPGDAGFLCKPQEEKKAP